MLIKGALHTDLLMHEVVQPETGLRTERRLSHAYIMDVPTYHKPLVLTDCAINIYPTLEDKVSICQNAIDLAHTLGVALPKVAVLSAVETVNPKITATLEAAALCKMADRGQITGGLSTGRWRWTTRSARPPRRSSTSGPRSPAMPTCSWCPTWRPATCWPSS